MPFAPARSLRLIHSQLAFAAAARLSAQQPHPLTAASVMGTYGLGTRQLPSPSRDGCWLEVAPLNADSVRVQVRCATPSPSHHVGVLDEHLAFRAASIVYETNQYDGHCRIAIRLASAQAIVIQEGNAAACGFGASVNVGGTYRRINDRRPSFDLAPIAR
jgi:hypothetical protein